MPQLTDEQRAHGSRAAISRANSPVAKRIFAVPLAKRIFAILPLAKRIFAVPLALPLILLIPGCPPAGAPKLDLTLTRSASGATVHLSNEKDADIAIGQLEHGNGGTWKLRDFRYSNKGSPVITARYPEWNRYYDSVDVGVQQGVGLLRDISPQLIPAFLRSAATKAEIDSSGHLLAQLIEAGVIQIPPEAVAALEAAGVTVPKPAVVPPATVLPAATQPTN